MYRIVSFFSVFVLVWTLGVSDSVGDKIKNASQAKDHAIEKLKPYLKSMVEDKGRARVIVQLQSPDEPFAQMVGPKARTLSTMFYRQGAIRRLQNRLIEKLRPRLHISFNHIPYMMLEVDELELERLAEQPGVVSIREDKLLQPVLDASVPQIGGDLAWIQGYTGAGQVIAVLDSGIDSSHSALAGKVVDEACFSTNNSSEYATSLCPNGGNEQVGAGAALNCTGVEGCDHGTHVAGITAADDSRYSGVAKDADLMAVQVFSRLDNFLVCGFPPYCLSAYTSDVIRGLEYVYDQRDRFDIAAVNMSLGGQSYNSQQACDDDNAALKAAIDNLRAAAIATVIASGNDGFYDAISVPACISTAISVGAVTGSDDVAWFSNSAPWLTSLAPGTLIDSAVPGGGFEVKDGTSMAAPHVAGAVAVLKSVAPDAYVDEIEDALTSSGVPITDERNGVVVPRVQVDAAAQVLNELYDISNVRLELDPVITGLNQPVAVTHAADGSGRLFIGQQSGQIMIHDGTQIMSTPFLDISHLFLAVPPGGREGLLSIAFHPQYAANGFFYVSYVKDDHVLVIARYSVSSTDANVADQDSEEVLLTVPAPPGDHYGGQLAFGADGFFYIGIGDGGADGDVVNTAGDLGYLHGKVLRVDVDAGTPYAIPPDNPFVSDPLARDEIWALGLRNPWRLSFDRLTGDLYIADVGETAYEEVNFQSGSSAGGEDYGWNVMEGSQCYNGSACDPTGLVPPLAAYDHSQGCAVIGGQVYRGQKYAMLRGVYFYADYCSGRIWGLKRNQTQWQSALLLDAAPTGISTFGDDEAGNVYLADHTLGDIYLVKTRFWVQTTSLPGGQVGLSYTTTLRASGGKRPYTWSVSAGSLPGGLTLDSGTGVISGVPTAEESSTFTILVQDSNLENATQQLVITIYPPLEIQTNSLPDAPVNQSYSQSLQVSGGRPPYTWTLSSGALPPGLSLNSDGNITGTPTQQWSYTFVVQVTDTDTVSVSRSLSIAVVGLSGTIEIPLIEGVTDTRGFGHNYGSDLHQAELIATFGGGTVDLALSVNGYDIDFADEVAVYLNDALIDYLRVGADNSLNGGDSFCIPVGDQLFGENRIKFVVKNTAWTWGLSNLLVAQITGGGSCPPQVPLTLDMLDTGQYGHNYGSNLHQTEVIATFTGTSMDLVLSVSGYDIDYADEVAVHLNGVMQGYLSAGLNNGLNGGNSFPIAVDDQLSGKNRIKFVQQTGGWTWGLTNLLLAQDSGSGAPPEVSLTVGVMDTRGFGHNYGSNQHQTEFIATFGGETVDLALSVSGYDIDYADEVAVYLNDVLVNYLRVGADNGLNSGDSFCIPVKDQLSGENRIKFVQKNAAWTWGVTNLLVAQDSGGGICPPQVPLTVDVLDTGQYGHNYGGNQHPAELIATFEGGTVDLALSVSGYDIDYADEVAVYLNDVLFDYLSMGADNGLNSGDSFCIPVGDQLFGENRIKFVVKNAAWIWGVTNLLVAQDSGGSSCLLQVPLTVDVLDTGQYGHNYGSNQHPAELIATFDGGTVDLVLSVSGYDIDYADEVAVYLNDFLQGYLSPGLDNGLNGGNSFPIPTGNQLSGENRIKFVVKNAAWTWGVTNLLVARDSGSVAPPEVPLTVDVLDTGQYGHNYGSNQHPAELIATFEGGTLDLVLSVNGYDIDFTDEVAVYLNDVLIDYLSMGADNSLNGGNSFCIPVGDQLFGENRIKFVVKNAAWTWGLTNLLVAQITGGGGCPPQVPLTVDVLDTGQYGHNYGSNQHETELIATFEGGTVDLVLTVSGYDIDYADEVAVHLNGVLQGYLSPGLNNGLNGGNGFPIAVDDQLSGKNRIKFVQQTAGWTWGLANLLLAH